MVISRLKCIIQLNEQMYPPCLFLLSNLGKAAYYNLSIIPYPESQHHALFLYVFLSFLNMNLQFGELGFFFFFLKQSLFGCTGCLRSVHALCSGGVWASPRGGGSRCRAQALGHTGSSSCSTWTQLLPGIWNLPEPEIELLSPALAGGFLTTVPPGKSCVFLF